MATASSADAAPGAAYTGLLAGLGAVVRHELRMLLFSPVTYLFQIGFLGLLSVCIFLVSDYYNENEASIASLLEYLPWLAVLLVPALAMRAWPQEQDDRSTELTLSLPIALPALVLGKFLAGWLLLCLTLLFTAALPATAYYLGEPDSGAMLAGYLGAVLMLGAYYALSLFGSALTRDPLAAFVVSLALLTALLAAGWDVSGRLLHDVLSAKVIGVLATFSPGRCLTDLSRGLVDARSVGPLAVLTVGGLVASGIVIASRGRRGGWRDRWRLVALLAATLVATILLIIGVARLPWSLDLTDEQEFTLDEGTRHILAALPGKVEVTLYWSAGQANVPNAIKAHARRIKDLLNVMGSKAGHGLTVRVVDPVPDTEAELEAWRAGMRRVPMSSGDVFYLGLTASEGARVGRVPYFDLRRASLLEYDLAVVFDGLTEARTPKIGVLTPLLPPAAAEAAEAPKGLSFLAELRRNYDVAVIPFFADEIPPGLDALVLIDATVLKRKTLFAIDQYLMRGGSLIVLVDPYIRVNPESNAVVPGPSPEVDDITDLLRTYGFGYEGRSVVGDATAAAEVRDADNNPLTYPYWLRLRTDNLSTSHPATAGLNELLLAEPGSFTIDTGGPVQPLIWSGAASGTIDRDGIEQGTPRERALAFKADGGRRVLAAVRRGRFDSAYTAPPEGAGPGFLTASQDPGLVFAVADVDWIFDAFALDSRSIGGDVVIRPLNDNLALLLNLVGYATGKEALISIRSRGRVDRAFTRVEALFREAEARLREEESALAGKVAEMEASLRRDAEAGATAQPALRSGANSTGMEERLVDLLAARRSLREIRARIRRDVDDLGQTVRLVNILSGPALVLLFWGGVAGLRRRGRKTEREYRRAVLPRGERLPG
jgi:ABC-2 type transport system permease protein